VRGLDQVAAGRKGEVIAGHQDAVGGGAVEQGLIAPSAQSIANTPHTTVKHPVRRGRP
jgi:hypothetical protein